ncbi:MAG: hypothetical protein V4787_13525 [Pseudomonadota bacterium]
MSTKTLPLIGAVLIAGAAWAQAPATTPPPAKVVGKVGLVQGLVTVSLGTSVASVVANGPVLEGSRFVTGSAGSLDLDFNEGCVVKLAPNQSLTVEPGKSCNDRKGAVAWLTGGGPVVAAGAGNSLSPLVGLGYVAGIALIDSTTSNTPAPTGGGGTPPGGGGGIPNPPPSGQ